MAENKTVLIRVSSEAKKQLDDLDVILHGVKLQSMDDKIKYLLYEEKQSK